MRLERRLETKMAIEKERDAALEELVRRGATELLAANPHLVDTPGPLPDDVIEQLEADEAELERIWAAIESERDRAPAHSTLDALYADRAE
jgi:hypothetical protein